MNYLKTYTLECDLEKNYYNRKLIESLYEVFSDKQIQIFTLRDIEGLTFKEIGIKMNMSYDVVRARYSKILRKLRFIRHKL